MTNLTTIATIAININNIEEIILDSTTIWNINDINSKVSQFVSQLRYLLDNIDPELDTEEWRLCRSVLTWVNQVWDDLYYIHIKPVEDNVDEEWYYKYYSPSKPFSYSTYEVEQEERNWCCPKEDIPPFDGEGIITKAEIQRRRDMAVERLYHD